MLRLAIAFFAISLLAALFGFGLVADISSTAAKTMCAVFLVLAVLSLIGGSLKKPSSV